MNMNGQIIAPPVPAGVEQDHHFSVQVRPVGTEAWTDVQTYAAWVDMHDVRQTAVGIFDFTGPVEVRLRPNVFYIHSAIVRPLLLGITADCDGHEVRFTLDRPADMMIEINKERFRCLHLFAGAIQPEPTEHVIHLMPASGRPRTTGVDSLLHQLAAMPKGRTLFFGPGLHVVGEYVFPVPSDTRLYLAPGAVVIGAFILQDVENVIIEGHGVILQRSFHRFSGINGVRISRCRNIRIEGVTFINPPHYTVALGGAENVTIRGIRSFSCEGWSDGIDMMSSHHIHVDGCFLRTSDDCIAIYGSRWDYHGGSHDVLVENSTLWADVAHPTNIGTHGDHEHDGDIIERITFRNIDILEHHEHQPGYLGCMAINPGDKNTVRDVLYEDVRVEHIEHGKLIDLQVKYNPDYNPAPGRRIERVTFRNIRCGCMPPVESVIAGYDAEHDVRQIRLENVQVCGGPLPLYIGDFASDVTVEDNA
ncbi:MAG: right-handed parallel beta-helix repeat-containing protein [Clostridia bacterium]|nr:right-handed parallel beta-helix repeat-containing protein [Clostridia bacterium]